MSTGSVIDPSFELVDPCPDIHALFIQFDRRFFGGALACCEVKWSPRMYSCAGICSYEIRGGRGGLCSIRLSQPLLKLRPRKDLVETLLHEMIHAYLFVKERNRDRDGHGPHFQEHMHRINKSGGTNITIYHSFHAEVALYKKHVWRCDGVCKDRRPFFGYIKRSSNRAPGPNDLWWKQHQSSCGGKFIKIKEPEGFGQRKRKTTKDADEAKTKTKKPSITLDDFWVSTVGGKNGSKNKVPTVEKKEITPFEGTGKKLGGNEKQEKPKYPIVPFSGNGVRLGGSDGNPKKIETKPKARNIVDDDIIVLDDSDVEMPPPPPQRPSSSHRKPLFETDYFDDDDELEISFVVQSSSNVSLIICPSCNERVVEGNLNNHLDMCLG